MSTSFGRGFHAPAGKPVDSLAYERWTGRWSRMFVPMVIAAAQIARGDRVLDVSTGTGEAAIVALDAVGASGLVIGADIAPAMLTSARERLSDAAFQPVAADGQALPRNWDGGFPRTGPCSVYPSRWPIRAGCMPYLSAPASGTLL